MRARELPVLLASGLDRQELVYSGVEVVDRINLESVSLLGSRIVQSTQLTTSPCLPVIDRMSGAALQEPVDCIVLVVLLPLTLILICLVVASFEPVAMSAV